LSLRILVVKLSSLGDVVHAMPAVQDMLTAYPDARIDWVVESAFAPLAARCAGVARTIVVDLRRWRKAPLAAKTRREWAVFKAALQQNRYDWVIDLQGLGKSALVAWLAQRTPTGKRVAMAHATDGSSYETPTRWGAQHLVTLPQHVHAVQRARLVCADALGYSPQGQPRFGLGATGPGAVRPALVVGRENPFAPRKPVVALVHGSSRADKQWPLASWVALAQRLNHSGFAVALAHGNAAELAVSHVIAHALEDAWVWPAMGLDMLTDTMARCAAVIGVDSGLSHIAVALGLPHVQIYNFDTAWRTGPPEAQEEGCKQTSVFGAPAPDLETVWQAWHALDTPVLCR
jgi:heptosyltransferase I